MDALPDDPVFFAAFVPFFDPRLGRSSTPMEVYLRLMFLKFRYRLDGARIWTGHGVLAHNLVKIAALAARPPADDRSTFARAVAPSART